MKILITGSSGFIGSYLKQGLTEYKLLCPSHKKLDLTKFNDVYNYNHKHQPDIIIHCADSNRGSWGKVECLKENLQMFFNLVTVINPNQIMYYFGSGVETSIATEYGLSKFIMNEYAKHSSNVYNLRLYGVIGKGDYKERFIPTCIRKKLSNEHMEIKEDRLFSYIYIKDLVNIMKRFVNKHPHTHCIDVCSTQVSSLKGIAGLIGVDYRIVNSELGTDYVGNPFNLLCALGGYNFTPTEQAIKEIM